MEWLIFFGRFHPLIVHLPIGFLLLGFAMELASRRQGFSHLRPALPFVLGLSAIGAAGTALLGYFLSLEGGYDGPLLSVHRWTGIAVAVMSLVVFFAYSRWPRLYLPLFTSTIILLLVAGHYGGSLTHGEGFITEATPSAMHDLLGVPPGAAAAAIDLESLDTMALYSAIVHPILDNKCISCHRSGKNKGELRLDTKAGITKGGENGPVLTAGLPEESPIIQRIHLPEDHDDHMPPEGKQQLTTEEKTLLEWWVREGADFEKPVGACEKDEAITQILETRFQPKAENPVYALPVEPLDDERRQHLLEAGLHVHPLAQGSPFLEVNLSNCDSLRKDQLELLKTAADQLVRLDLGHSNVTDAMLQIVPQLPHLTHLYLQRTSITDAGLAQLEGLQYLEYLNLYGTPVSDAGMATLVNLPLLQQLYLWQTKVSEAGIRQLQKSHPELMVIQGMQVDTLFGSVE